MTMHHVPNGGHRSALGRFFFAPILPHALCALRVLVGAYLLVSLLLLFPFVMRYLPDGGPVSFDLVRREIGPDTFTLLAIFRNPVEIFLLHCTAIAAAFCMMIGRWTRLSTLVLAVIYLSYMNAVLYAWDGGDTLTTNILFLLTLGAFAGHTNVAYAVDAARARKRGDHVPSMIPAWTLRLLQVQLCMMYFFSGWYKTQYLEWQSGEAMHYVIQQLAFLMLPLYHLSHWPAFISALTLGIVFLEIAAPFLFWVPPLRGWVLGALALFHVLIRLTMHVFAFGIAIPLMIVFIEPETVRRWTALLTRQKSR